MRLRIDVRENEYGVSCEGKVWLVPFAEGEAVFREILTEMSCREYKPYSAEDYQEQQVPMPPGFPSRCLVVDYNRSFGIDLTYTLPNGAKAFGGTKGIWLATVEETLSELAELLGLLKTHKREPIYPFSPTGWCWAEI